MRGNLKDRRVVCSKVSQGHDRTNASASHQLGAGEIASVSGGRQAVFPLEGSMERSRGRISKPLKNLRNRELRFLQPLGGQAQAAGGNVGHWAVAHSLTKPRRENGTREPSLGGKRLERPGMPWFVMNGCKGGCNRRIAQSLPP